jgi:hypothetical protein
VKSATRRASADVRLHENPRKAAVSSGTSDRRWRDDRGQVMTLAFPNRMRSFDATRRAVRFWGHDGAMEACFFVSEEALQRVHPDAARDESGLLGAFDAHRDRIHQAAAKVYARGRKGSYDVGSSDF